MELKDAKGLYKTNTLPPEWNERRLGEIADLQVGYAFKSAWFEKQGDIRLLRGKNVGYGRADWSDTRTLAPNLVESFREYRLNPGDVIIGMDRTFTKSGTKISVIHEEDCPCLLVQRVGRFIPRGCHPSFLWVILSSDRVQTLLRLEQKGMDIPHLSRAEILSPKVSLPPLPEQRAIAAALSDVDALIAALDQLIVKQRDLKQAVTQKLLAGVLRLTNFQDAVAKFEEADAVTAPDDWECVSISEIAIPSSLKNSAGRDLPVLSCSKHVGFVDSLEFFTKQIFSDDTTGYRVIRRGELGYPANHIEEGSIGYQDLYDESLVSPIYVVFSLHDNVNGSSIYRILKTERYRQLFAALRACFVIEGLV